MEILKINELNSEIDFYDKVILNKLYRVDAEYTFLEEGVIIASNIIFEKHFLKNSIDKINGVINDKFYKEFINIVNSIITKEKRKNNNILIKSKKHEDFLLIMCKKDQQKNSISILDSIENILKSNNLNYFKKDVKDNTEKYQLYRLSFQR